MVSVRDTLTIVCPVCHKDVATVRSLFRPDDPPRAWMRSYDPATGQVGRYPKRVEVTAVNGWVRDVSSPTEWRYRIACGGRRGHKTQERIFTEETLLAHVDFGRISLAEIRRRPGATSHAA
mgnify:FL=1